MARGNFAQQVPGDDWQKFGRVRAPCWPFMCTHPGKKTIFMGMEFGQRPNGCLGGS